MLMNNIPEYSAIVIIMLFLIKEMFSFLRGRKNGENSNSPVLKILNSMKENDIKSVERKVDKIDDKLDDIKNILIEIKGIIKK